MLALSTLPRHKSNFIVFGRFPPGLRLWLFPCFTEDGFYSPSTFHMLLLLLVNFNNREEKLLSSAMFNQK